MRLLVSTFEGKFRDLPRCLWVKAGRRLLDTPEIDAPPNKPRAGVSYSGGRPAAGPAQVNVLLQPMVEMPYGVKGFENEDRSPKDKKTPGPGLSASVGSQKKPSPEETPAPLSPCRRSKWRWVTSHCGHQWNGVRMGELADNDSSAERLLALWMERPASAGEQRRTQAVLRVVPQGASAGRRVDAALRSAFHSVLMSAPFRYLSPATESQHATASRLSHAHRRAT